LIIATGKRWGSGVFAAPVPDVSRDPIVQEALRVLEQRQKSQQAARVEREVQARAQAHVAVAVGKKFGIRVLASDE
jgi:hypothetical protein